MEKKKSEEKINTELGAKNIKSIKQMKQKIKLNNNENKYKYKDQNI